jgi:ATP-binding cassette, subfamily B, bacterial
VVLMLTVSAGALGAIEPLLLKRIVDALFAHQGMPPIVTGVAALGGLYLLREGMNAISNWLTWRTRIRVQHAILDAAVGRLHHLSIAYHRTQPVGMLLTKLDRGIQGLVGAFSDLAFNLVPALVFFVLALALMLRLEWRLCLLLVVLLPFPALIGVVAARHQTARDRTLLDRWTRIYARFNEVLSGIVTVKSFAMEHAEKQRFIHNVDQANEVVVRGVGFDSRITLAQNTSVALTRLAVLGYGAYLAVEGQITPGTLLAFLGYVTGLFGPVQGLTTIYQTLRRATVSVDAIFSILDADDAVRDPPGAQDIGRLRGEVAFNNVWFGYQSEKFVLRGINFGVTAGSTVALVGPSGAGKTTLAVLLQRLYEPQEGEILIDGVDLRTITQESLRRQIGVVMQDASLFNESVRANIAYGRPNATQQEIEAAARAANAHEFIMSMPQGYDTEVGERGNVLSAGQRQRIAIARAILKDPPIVILDEATSSLDAESEAQVQEALGRLLRGRTTLVIAHRLSTVVNADHILVLRSGRIVEQGSHATLIEQEGYYSFLVSLQTRGLVDNQTPRSLSPVRPAAGVESQTGTGAAPSWLGRPEKLAQDELP